MTRFRAPESATTYAGLDDAAFADGAPVSAHVIRTLARQVNRALERKSLVYRWLGVGNPSASSVSTFAPPFWGQMTPCAEVPLFYRPGISRLRCRVRMMAEGAAAGFHGIDIGYVTSRSPRGNLDDVGVTHSPNGLTTTSYETFIIPVSIDGQDTLSLWWRANIEGDEPLMSTATHGGINTGNNNGNSRSGSCILHTTLGTPWNVDQTNANAIQRNGHWIRFLYSTYEVGRGEIRDGDNSAGELVNFTRLFYEPTVDDWRRSSRSGTTWEIRQLPEVRLHSIAIYEDS